MDERKLRTCRIRGFSRNPLRLLARPLPQPPTFAQKHEYVRKDVALVYVLRRLEHNGQKSREARHVYVRGREAVQFARRSLELGEMADRGFAEADDDVSDDGGSVCTSGVHQGGLDRTADDVDFDFDWVRHDPGVVHLARKHPYEVHISHVAPKSVRLDGLTCVGAPGSLDAKINPEVRFRT